MLGTGGGSLPTAMRLPLVAAVAGILFSVFVGLGGLCIAGLGPDGADGFPSMGTTQVSDDLSCDDAAVTKCFAPRAQSFDGSEVFN